MEKDILSEFYNTFTPREIDVLGYMKQGMSGKEISDSLCIDIETVNTHKKHIMEKLGIHKSAKKLFGISSKMICPDRISQGRTLFITDI